LIKGSDNLDPQCHEQSEDDTLTIVQDVIIIDPEYPQSSDRFQIMLALFVLNATVVMAPTIELHNQSVGHTIEIDDIWPHRVLTAELRSRQPAVAKQTPEGSLR